MMIIGVDYHPSFQTIAFLTEETGEYDERELNHSDGEAERFYRDLQQRGIRVRVGMEATGYSRWFERLLAELGFELWIGDPAEIKAKRVKKRKTDREDARLLLRLMRENNFPQVWIPSPENRDLRQLLWHRHRMVAVHCAPERGKRASTPRIVITSINSKMAFFRLSSKWRPEEWPNESQSEQRVNPARYSTLHSGQNMGGMVYRM